MAHGHAVPTPQQILGPRHHTHDPEEQEIDPNLLETTTYSDNLMKAYTDIKKHYGRPKSVEAVIDIGCSLKYATYQVGVSPTLCAHRSASLGYFSTTLQRRLSVRELMRLQGANPQKLNLVGTSRCALGEMVGNVMSINVVERVLEQALEATKLPRLSASRRDIMSG